MMPKINFVIGIAKKRGGKVLEIGCGYGYLSLELARNGLDVAGVDLSPRSIEIAKKYARENPFKKNFGSLKYKAGNVLAMNLGKNEYDSVVFFGSLHHMPNINRVLSKVHAALKKGGNLIVCEPVSENFTRQSAEFAAVLRAILPTWIPYEKKLKNLDNPKAWNRYVEDIFNEYTYRSEHKQSPCDNITDSEKLMVNAIKKHFRIKTILYSDAFIDKLIGGLRGKYRYRLARFLKALDDDLIKRKVLPPTFIRVHAVKR
jgi:2-polyprenyl-3-methyl-5-hydroxy-6-metoxy-1,4-benzoquinol methylase